MAIKPSKKPDGMNQDYWDARNRVSIDIQKFFKWINAEWDVQKVMSGYYRTATCNDTKSCSPGCKDSCSCCQRSENTTHSSTTYVSVTDGGGTGPFRTYRKNDCPKGDGTGPVPRWIKGTCDNFNAYPSSYGKIPEADLRKRRYNVCFQTEAMGYFRTTYKRKDIGPWEVCGCPGAQNPNPAEIQPSSNTDSRTFQSSTCGQCDCDKDSKGPIKCFYGSCRTSFYSAASISFDTSGTWYDPETRKVYPAINLSGAYPNFGWHGDHPKDTPARGAYKKHTTSTNVTVDGVSIPCGTSWYSAGYEGNISLSITYTLKERAL
jgi:hypothetical protein